MSEREQAIVAAARAYVEALENLAEVRKQRGGHWEWREYCARGQEKCMAVRYDDQIKEARAARKRTLSRLRRAVDGLRPLPGQKVLFDFPIGQER